jgi:hypothetical protein
MSMLSSRPSGKVLVLVVLILSVVALIGCGGSEEPTAATTETSATTTTAASGSTDTTVPTGANTSSTSAAPAGEIGATASVSSKNGGYPTTDIPDWSQIKSVVAFRDASYGVASIWVCLATDEVTANSISEYWELPSPAAGQGRIQLLLTRTLLDVNEPPLVTGTYDFNTPQGKAELTGEAEILVANGIGIRFVPGDATNSVKVTVLSDTEISGTFHVKDGWTEISGSFTAPVK